VSQDTVSCVSCKEELPRERFAPSSLQGTNRRRACRACESRRRAQRQQGTLNTADHHRQPWSSEELQQLEEAVAAGTPQDQIAIQLGRTYNSVTCKLHVQKRLVSGGA
jgi:hypothetical protein